MRKTLLGIICIATLLLALPAAAASLSHDEAAAILKAKHCSDVKIAAVQEQTGLGGPNTAIIFASCLGKNSKGETVTTTRELSVMYDRERGWLSLQKLRDGSIKIWTKDGEQEFTAATN